MNRRRKNEYGRQMEAMFSKLKPMLDLDFGDDDDVEDDLSLAGCCLEYFDDLLYGAPEELVDDVRRFRFENVLIYQNGEIHATCRDGGNVYPVLARAFPFSPPAACGCPVSQGEAACVHAVKFVEYLTQELSEIDSPLRRRVNTEDFVSGTPKMETIEIDPVQQMFHDLDAELEQTAESDVVSLVDHDTVTRRLVKSQSRLAWRVEFGQYGIEVYPVGQQPKKRGSGYTKGRRIKLATALRDQDLMRTSQDRRVIGCIEYQESYYSYRDEMVLNVFPAIRALIGAPNVYIDKDQVVVRRDDFEFEVVQINDHYHVIVLLTSDDELSRQYLREQSIEALRRREEDGEIDRTVALLTNGEDTLIRVSLTQRLVSIFDFDPSDERLIMTLLKFPGVPVEQGGELFKRLKRIQTRLTIRLPESSLGPIVDVSSKPVVLMRSNSDGSLDMVLRVRDAAGRILIPGASPAIATGEQDDQPVQFRRNISQEIDQAERLATALRFDAMEPDDALAMERYAAHITDFGEILNLIDRLQSWTTSEGSQSGFDHTFDGLPAPEVLWDRNSEKPVSVLGSISTGNVKVEINRKRDWFGISGQCDVGGKQLDLNDLLQNLSSEDPGNLHGDFIKLKDGQWARIGEKLRRRLSRLRDATHADRKTMKLDATAAPAIRDFLSEGEIEFKAVKAWNQCLERLARSESLDPELPKGLDANLRDYQVEGYRWLRRLAEWGVGGVLADDMGLGKTLQTLAVLLDRKDEGPTLVIAPTSVAFNWVREAERFTPGLSVHLYRETDRTEFLKTVGAGDLVVCSYGLALRDSEALAGVEWGSLVLDEAQAIKNSRSKTSKAIGTIPAKWTIALTGTPVENHLGELWSLFHVVSPGVFGGWEQFRKRFAMPIEKENNEAARAGLAERLKPFVLRRKKSEVLKDLPPRTDMNLYVDLSKGEREEYERVRLEAIGEVDQIESLTKTQDQRFRILALLTRLRQISCHAKLVNASYEGEAAKLVQLRETLSNLKEEGHRALIFSQFTEHLALIRNELDESGFTYEYLDGSTPAKARQDRVDAFQNGSADAFLISLKAGGTGLNLTAADYVIHMDPWWNPAVEDQATDRAHRIGQDKPVMVYRIIARGTIEEEILALHETKRDLVAGVMEGTAAAAKLNNDELIAMLRKSY